MQWDDLDFSHRFLPDVEALASASHAEWTTCRMWLV